MTESASGTGPLRAPNWTTRDTLEALARAPQLGGVAIRKPGWYDVPGGVALLSSEQTASDGSVTLRASVWDSDPRELLAAAVMLPVIALAVQERFASNWGELVRLSSELVPQIRAKITAEAAEVQPLPATVPAHTTACGDPDNGGHYHFGQFKVYFISLPADEVQRIKEDGSRPSENSKILFLADGVIVIDYGD